MKPKIRVVDIPTTATAAETSLDSLTHRHMPAIHKALAEIRGMLQ